MAKGALLRGIAKKKPHCRSNAVGCPVGQSLRMFSLVAERLAGPDRLHATILDRKPSSCQDSTLPILLASNPQLESSHS